MTRNPSNDYDRWCEIAASLRDRTCEERHTILASLGLSQRWEGIRSHWALVLLDDAERGDLTRVERLEARCDQERARRARGEDAWLAVISAARVPPAQPARVVDFRQALCGPMGTPEPNTDAPERQRQSEQRAVDAEASAAGDALQWAVERFAAFAAALSAGRDAGAVAIEFGVVAGAVEPIIEAWTRRLRANPLLEARYLAHFQAARGATREATEEGSCQR